MPIFQPRDLQIEDVLERRLRDVRTGDVLEINGVARCLTSVEPLPDRETRIYFELESEALVVRPGRASLHRIHKKSFFGWTSERWIVQPLTTISVR